MDYRQEDNNYPKAFLATGIIMALLIGLSYFIVFHQPPKEEDGTGGILVNYGTVDEGMGDDYMSTEEPSVAEKANQTKPDKVTPTPPTEQVIPIDNSSQQVVTQNTEDAPEINNDKKPSQTVATQQKPTKEPPKEVVNQNALYKGKTNNGAGEGDGNDDKPGNKGVKTGSTLTPDYGQGGQGGTGSLSNMPQRSFVSKPTLTTNKTAEGEVVIDIIADQDGNIIYAEPGRGTKMTDNSLIQKCVEAAKRAKISPSKDGLEQQKGKIVFRFKIQ